MNIETQIALLAEQVADLRARLGAMRYRVPRQARERERLEEQLQRIRLDLRQLKRIRDGAEPRKPQRRLIPYAGSEHALDRKTR